MIQESIYKHLLKYDNKLLYEDLKEKTSKGMFIESVETIKKDIVKNETIKLTFSIFYKIDAIDTLTRLKASNKLQGYWQYLKDNKLIIEDEKINFIKFELNSLATLNSRDENGAYIYQIVISCIYKHRKEK